jgi:ribonuclease VapC
LITVDASAVLAILLGEPEGPAFKRVLLNAGHSVISPVNHWEVLARAYGEAGDLGRMKAEALLAEFNIHVGSVDAETSRAAADAFARVGRRTPAGLNLGDCFAYALAAAKGDGLLCKGEDFPKTDILIIDAR